MNERIKSISDINEYLDVIQTLKGEYIIAIAVRDTAGNNMPEEILEKVKRIGFTTFSNELWYMYAGVRWGDKTLADCSSEVREQNVRKRVLIKERDLTLDIISRSWRNGDKASIKINKVECAVNKRGINIVVYDSVKKCVLDSIRFDSHEKQFIFERNNKIDMLNEKIRWIYGKEEYDVCVVGVWFGANYGSVLNGYATYKVLKSLNKKTLMLHKIDAPDNDPELSEKNHNVKFYNKYYPSDVISPLFTGEELELLNDHCDCFCAGSDQIWNYPISFSEKMYLPFVRDDKWCISFGTSFGSINDNVPETRRNEIKEYFNRFESISVREYFSAKILKEKYGVVSEVLLDPVFCIEKKEYYSLTEDAIFDEKDYILAYILDPTDEKAQFLNEVAQQFNKRIITICDGKYGLEETSWGKYSNKEFFPGLKTNIEVVDFLKAFSNTDYVVTDSFHGVAFSLIFEKNFIAISNPRRGKERFYDILNRVELESRLVDEGAIGWESKFILPIDYKRVNAILEKEKNKTISWLSRAMSVSNNSLESSLPTVTQERDLDSNPEFRKIRILATLLRDYGVKHIVLSPGGRDVPLVRMFEYNEGSFTLHRVTDERSAGYYGLGIATQLREPIACVCTSGTAASNFLPAVTEAYYTSIPLIVITADRMEVYHGQGEDQTIPQKNIYANVIKKSITIPEGAEEKCLYQTRRDISECILETTHNGNGPVHINFAIDNVGLGANVSSNQWKLLPRINPHILRVGLNDGRERLMDWLRELEKSQKILIVYGQNYPLNDDQKKWVESFVKKYNCVIAADHISNIDCPYCVKPYNMLNSISQKEFNEKLSPDILITVGGKRLMNDPLTFKIRGGLSSIRHWSVTPNGKVKDFYFRLTSVLEMTQDKFFEWFSNNTDNNLNNGVYYEEWRQLENKYHSIGENVAFDSNYIQSKFLPSIPKNSILHLGVGQSFYECRKYDIGKTVEVHCNMGTNGIDGCTSTFMGQCSVVVDKLCFLLVGDLSFFYDMNSIWNKPLRNNMRILMVNNSGSGLLRGNNLKSITAAHNTSAKGWVESTGFEYISSRSKEEFDEKLEYFISSESETAIFWEVFCK